MGVEDELRARVAARDEQEQHDRRQAETTREQQQRLVERALKQVRVVTLEANRMLIDAKITPARLTSYRPLWTWFPSIGRMLGDIPHGRGWAVIDHVVVDTDGHLWSTEYRSESYASRLRGRSKIRVDKDGGPGRGPDHWKCDAGGFYQIETDDQGLNPIRIDFLDQLKDGYAELIRHYRQ